MDTPNHLPHRRPRRLATGAAAPGSPAGPAPTGRSSAIEGDGAGTAGHAPRSLRTSNEDRCRRILGRSGLLVVDDLDWDAVGAVVLDPGVLATLVYMRDVEGFTDSYVAGIGAHRTTLADPLIGEFLEIWTAEEAAHSLAIGRFLDAYSEARGEDLPALQPSPSREIPTYERVLAHLGGPVGRLVAAAHMAWGAANELLTMNGYRILAEQCGDPVLAELLRRIAAQESRHYSFYLLQAQWRLANSRLARAVLPRILDGRWTPVGVGEGYKTDAEFQRVLAVLNASPATDKIIDRMDQRFAALPGCEHLRIFRDAATPSQGRGAPVADVPNLPGQPGQRVQPGGPVRSDRPSPSQGEARAA